ncbi:hypothetical protein MA16_Dca025587 [Dendrobium catenatum]|uniref:Uncharacterized protein n=1 Tax=Dendrobium catenatum TaxID=906689 RepID=A0A2I0V832_9ASPA|nr:hypothetical protein MA16_Dca025587 [Dendrobium catenatum]
MGNFKCIKSIKEKIRRNLVLHGKPKSCEAYIRSKTFQAFDCVKVEIPELSERKFIKIQILTKSSSKPSINHSAIENVVKGYVEDPGRTAEDSQVPSIEEDVFVEEKELSISDVNKEGNLKADIINDGVVVAEIQEAYNPEFEFKNSDSQEEVLEAPWDNCIGLTTYTDFSHKLNNWHYGTKSFSAVAPIIFSKAIALIFLLYHGAC